MNKIEDMISATKLNEILHKRDEDKIKKTVLWILAIVGAIVAIGAIAYAVYRFVTPNYLEDFEDDFEMSLRMISRMTTSKRRTKKSR